MTATDTEKPDMPDRGTTRPPSIPPYAGAKANSHLPEYGPLEAAGTPNVMNALLKHPGRVAYEIHQNRGSRLSKQVILLCVLCLTVYGLGMASFSGGMQWFWTPVKLAGGLAICAAICFPSLYIFSCLSGIDCRLCETAQTLLGAIGLISLLLVGLVPVSWVFSTSTESVVLMGFLHLLFWGISFFFGMRFLLINHHLKCGRVAPYMVAWAIIFGLVCLQMSTTLRPILGSSEKPFTREKRFFIQHWSDSMSTDAKN